MDSLASDSDMPNTPELLCEGDTAIIHHVLHPFLAETAFEYLEHEVQWQRMSHQGGEVPRLVAVQGEVDEQGYKPVYRHPADESPPLLPFSPTVLEIKAEVEKHLGHPLNHVLIQFYRDGNDYISEHSDKTLDIVHGSYIANLSLGAERTMVFRTKRLDKDPSRRYGGRKTTSSDENNTGDDSEGGAPIASNSNPAPPGDASQQGQKRRIQRARLPHNSLCRMGLVTNMRWLHAIRQDKRLEREKTPAELAFWGRRISLTFRRIGTFLDGNDALIWGQGAVGKSREEARRVTNGQTAEAVRMLQAFGTENHASEFDWERYYGGGFDVLHISAAPRLFAGPDETVNMRVKLMLAELDVKAAKGSLGIAREAEQMMEQEGLSSSVDAPIRFVDNDPDKATVDGQVAIMLYLDALYDNRNDSGDVNENSNNAGNDKEPPAIVKPGLAARLTRFQRAITLLDRVRAALDPHMRTPATTPDDPAASSPPSPQSQKAAALKCLGEELATWEGWAKESRDREIASRRRIAAHFESEVESEVESESGSVSVPQPFHIASENDPSANRPSIVDFALWPVLNEMACTDEGRRWLGRFACLEEYHARIWVTRSVAAILGGHH